MRRTSFRSTWTPAPKLRDRPDNYLTPVARAGVLADCSGMGVAVRKVARAPGGKAEQAHKDALAALGCMVCRRLYGVHQPGPVELHHRRSGGWGKGDYLTLMPLCHEHHQGATGVHGMGTKGFAAHYGFDQQDLLDDALRLLAGKGTA